MDQEKIMQMQMIEKEAEQFNQQFQLITQNITELKDLAESLTEVKKDTPTLINLGKKIYLPVEVKDNKLVVEVGKGHFVKKSVEETKKIIHNQLVKLEDSKQEISEKLEELNKRLESLFNNINDSQGNLEEQSKENN